MFGWHFLFFVIICGCHIYVHPEVCFSNVKTSYSIQLKYVTWWQRFDVRRTSWSHLESRCDQDVRRTSKRH